MEFINILTNDSSRNSSELMHRLPVIQSSINKFSSYVGLIERTPFSGYNVDDTVSNYKTFSLSHTSIHIFFHSRVDNINFTCRWQLKQLYHQK